MLREIIDKLYEFTEEGNYLVRKDRSLRNDQMVNMKKRLHGESDDKTGVLQEYSHYKTTRQE
jgi:hypothetical protein